MDLSQKDFDFKGLLDSHCLREAGAGGSNPLTPTSNFNDLDERRTVDTGPSEPAKPQHVYVMRAGPWCKIGIANNVYSRLKNIQTGNPLPVSLIFTQFFAPGVGAKVEAASHHVLERLTERRGEWFLVTPAIAIRIVKGEMWKMNLRPLKDMAHDSETKLPFSGYSVHIDGERIV